MSDHWLCSACGEKLHGRPPNRNPVPPNCPKAAKHGKMSWVATSNRTPVIPEDNPGTLTMTNPCVAPKDYDAVTGHNKRVVTITITPKVWGKVPPSEQELILSLLASQPISVIADLKATGNCIKRESDGWTIHTQTNMSLYDKKPGHLSKDNATFVFDRYERRPH